MADATRTTRFQFWLWLVRMIGVIVPRRLRADWRREWEAELRHREELLAEWGRLDWRNKIDLLRAVIRSVYGFILRRGATVELRPAFQRRCHT
ncbi:MAG TPA: hypothetical protein VI260_29710 [Blastocatellia bacterium]